jgi:hypothetical protein
VFVDTDKGVRASNGIQLDVGTVVSACLASSCIGMFFMNTCSVQSRDNYLVAGPDADHPPDQA